MMIIERAFNSFQARVIQPWKKTHYEITGYGRRIKELQGCCLGKRCFFIGNGPSLRAEDLTLLHSNNEITFAFNRIYNIFDTTSWRPTYYISQDEKMLLGCANTVNESELGIKFIPINLKWYYGIEISGAYYFFMAAPQERNGEPLDFSDNAAHGIFQGSTGMYTAAQLAVYMGFKEIYLLGVDHHFQVSQNNKGEIVVDNTVRDYFCNKYNSDKENLYIPNTEKSTLTYVAMKKHCDLRGIKVYNVTRGGKLEVFPRVDFDSLFE